MGSPLFSIIVPIYNTEIFLRNCIESILIQSYESFELILVDDGSTDKSFDICHEYKDKDKRIKVIHQKNKGLVSARKAGASVAQGVYAVCIDSDDWIASDYLVSLSGIVEEFSPDIICFDHYEVIKGKEVQRCIQFRKGFYTKREIEQEIFPSLIQSKNGKSFPPAIWAKVYKMNLYRLEQLEVGDKIKIAEDVACTMPCIAKANSLYILNKCLYYYRRNDTSMTKIKKPFSWDGEELICSHLQNRLSEFDFQEQINRRTVRALVAIAKTQFYGEGKYRYTVCNIKKHLRRPMYFAAITSSHFSLFSIVGVFAFFLKHEMFIPVYLLSKIR